MKHLKERILTEGKVVDARTLSVASFLNQQMDPVLLDEIGSDFARFFAEMGATRVLTVESSGIAPALMTAFHLGVPVTVVRKHKTVTQQGDHHWHTCVHSFTHQMTYQVSVDKDYLLSGDRVLIVDDFLARGHAVLGMMDLVEQAGGSVCGVGVVIHKAFEPGLRLIQEAGLPFYAQATLESLEGGQIKLASDLEERTEGDDV